MIVYVLAWCALAVSLAVSLTGTSPAMAQTIYWEPGSGAAPDTHPYTICDTKRQVCYHTTLEFVTPVLHNQIPYWVVRADMTILAGFPPNTIYPRGFVADAWQITGEPTHDIALLGDIPPPGIPASTYVLLYDGVMSAPFVDQSRTLADSLYDTIFGLNHIMDGVGIIQVGERWGDAVVISGVDGLYLVEYVGEGSASFLVDPTRPIPLAGIYRADRYDPHVGDTMWFYSDMRHMDMLLGVYEHASVDVSGPDDVLRAGTLDGLSWTSETYEVKSYTATPGRATIRGEASGPGSINVVLPAFANQYTFWQDDTQLDVQYTVSGGVLSGVIPHGTGDITIHSIPDDVCTGECLEGLIIRAWSGPSAIVYGSGFHGAVRMSMVPGDPHGVAPAACPPGSVVTVDFDVIQSTYHAPILPYSTTYESALDVSLVRSGSTITAAVSGDAGAITLRMPAMTGHTVYFADGHTIEPLAESAWHDTVTATIQHTGGNITYVATADGPTAWKGGLAIPPPTGRTGVVWCGMAEPVNSAVIQDTGVARQDCGVSKFRGGLQYGGWNVWC